jgi:hypothetical protein
MNKTLIIAGVLILLIAGFFAFNNYIYQEKQADPNETYEPYRGTLSGTQTCLPHKNTAGPQTLECAIGMKTDSGEYYALDFSMMSQGPVDVSNGERFTATGLITPIENLSSDFYQKYDVEGIFSVTDSVVIEKENNPEPKPTPAPVTPEPIVKKCYIGGCSSQLCSDEPGMASTCEYREEYACYRTAECKVQPDGECGWTETAELKACLGIS